jgi:serine protease Do
VKLSERPARERRLSADDSDEPRPQPSSQRDPGIGISVRELDREFAVRFRLHEDLEGVVVTRVEPMSPAFDADIERGYVVLEINRHPVRSTDDYRRLTAGARAGDVLAFYLYVPELQQRALRTVRIDDR